MPTTAWRFCGTGSSYGSNPWADPGNITDSDDQYANGTGKTPGTLRATNFGFTSSDIPAGATIVGIEVGVERYRGVGGAGYTDSVVQLCIDSAGTSADRIGSNQSTGATWQTTESETVFGGASNLFGASPTRAQVLASSFGFDHTCSSSTGGDVYVDAIRMRVTYSTGTAYTLTAATGSFTISGQQAALSLGRQLAASVGSFSLAGQPVGILTARNLAANTGGFIITGNAANLTTTAVYSLAAGTGPFALNTSSAALVVGRQVFATAGSFNLTANAAALIFNPAPASYRAAADAGSFMLSGQSADFRTRLPGWRPEPRATAIWTAQPIGGVWTPSPPPLTPGL